MARKPMVTRTIVTTKATALCLDTVKCEPMTLTVVLPRTYKNAEKLLKAVKERVEAENEDVSVAKVTSVEEVETLYGMSEQTFIDNAVVLDPTTRKALEEAEDGEDTEDEE